MNTLYSHTQIFMGIKSLNSVPRLPWEEGRKDGHRRLHKLFSECFIYENVYSRKYNKMLQLGEAER